MTSPKPDPNVQPATPEVPVPVVQTAVPPAVNVGLPPSSTTLAADDANIDFRRKYDELRGTLKSGLSQWDETYGELTARLKAASAVQGQYQALQTQQAALLAEREVTKTRLLELQTSANQVTTMAAQNEKLNSILRFPKIVTAAKQVEVEGEDGQKTTKTVNPLLDLALSSSLTGAKFATLLGQIAGQIAQPLSQQVATPNNPAEMITTSPPPVTTESKEAMQAQATEAMDAGDYDLFYKLQDKIVAMP